MGIISIRKMAHKLLLPVVILLCVGLVIGIFYIGMPSVGKVDPSYKGPSIKLDGVVLSDADFQKYLMQAAQQAQSYAQYGMAMNDDQIQDLAVTLAIKSMAFKAQMKKVESKIKVSGSEVADFIKKRWSTEEELQNIMQQVGTVDKNEFRKLVADSLEQMKFISYKGRQLKIAVKKQDVENSLKQITVSHVLISDKDPNTGKELRTAAQALQRAQEVYQKATAGGNFADLAKQYSDDPGSKEKGGSLGAMPLDQFKSGMVKEFVDAAMAMKTGEISQPVKSQFGYHIIKLDAFTVPKGDEYKEKYTEAEDQLLLQKTQQNPKFESWVTKINKKADQNAELLDPGLRAYRFVQKEQWAEAASAYKKALSKGYYNSRMSTYLNLSQAYLKLNQADEATKTLLKTPVQFREDPEYQFALAKAYQAGGKSGKAVSILKKLSASAVDDENTHQKIKQIYSDWKMTAAAAAEDKVIAAIAQKKQDELKKQQEQAQQQQLQQTQQQPAQSPAAQ